MKDVTCLKDFRAASCCRSDSSGAMPGKAAQVDSIIVPKYWCGGTASKGEGIVQCLIWGGPNYLLQLLNYLFLFTNRLCSL